MSKIKNTIAFFDFDGTITTKDTMIQLIIKTFGYQKYFLSLLQLTPFLLAFKLKIISNQNAKQKLLNYFFKDMNIYDFNKICNRYITDYIHFIINEKAIHKIKWHKKKNHQIVVVSASIENWVKPWCEMHNLKFIATKLEVSNKKITGNILNKNCYGIEKVNRIKELYDLNNYSNIYAYGNSLGDKEMLEVADFSFYKNF